MNLLHKLHQFFTYWGVVLFANSKQIVTGNAFHTWLSTFNVCFDFGTKDKQNTSLREYYMALLLEKHTGKEPMQRRILTWLSAKSVFSLCIGSLPKARPYNFYLTKSTVQQYNHHSTFQKYYLSIDPLEICFQLANFYYIFSGKTIWSL